MEVNAIYQRRCHCTEKNDPFRLKQLAVPLSVEKSRSAWVESRALPLVLLGSTALFTTNVLAAVHPYKYQQRSTIAQTSNSKNNSSAVRKR